MRRLAGDVVPDVRHAAQVLDRLFRGFFRCCWIHTTGSIFWDLVSAGISTFYGNPIQNDIRTKLYVCSWGFDSG